MCEKEKLQNDINISSKEIKVNSRFLEFNPMFVFVSENALKRFNFQLPEVKIFPKPKIPTKLKPGLTYVLKQNQNGNTDYEFLNNGECKLSFIKCPNLLNDNCNSFGLKMKYKLTGMELIQKVCQSNHIYKQEIGYNSTLISTIWMSSRANVNKIWCYLCFTN